MDPQDFYISGSSSNCCGAELLHGGLCSECHEHAEDDSGDDQEESHEGPSDAAQEAMRESAHRLMEAYRKVMIDAGRGHLLPP
jgi:hypothetical protein